MSAMVHCDGCGFNVEPGDASLQFRVDSYGGSHCATCARCNKTPELRESYRRGFNAGLDALAKRVNEFLTDERLRK